MLGPGLRYGGYPMRILRERRGGCSQRTKLIPLGVTDLHLCCRSEVFALHESNPRDAGLTWKSERNRAWGWRKNTWGVEGHVFAGVVLMNAVVACGPAAKGVSPPTPGQCLLALRFHPGGQAAGPHEWTPGDRGREIPPCKRNIWKLLKAYFSTSLQQSGH